MTSAMPETTPVTEMGIEPLVERLRRSNVLHLGNGPVETGVPLNPDGPEAADLIEQLTSTRTPEAAQVESLFPAIAHGDDEHRAWLKEAIEAHFAGTPVPPVRGKGRKEAQVDILREALVGAREHIRKGAVNTDDLTMLATIDAALAQVRHPLEKEG